MPVRSADIALLLLLVHAVGCGDGSRERDAGVDALLAPVYIPVIECEDTCDLIAERCVWAVSDDRGSYSAEPNGEILCRFECDAEGDAAPPEDSPQGRCSSEILTAHECVRATAASCGDSCQDELQMIERCVTDAGGDGKPDVLPLWDDDIRAR
ncbi:MAG: hypothetical protein AAF411_19170 [Myxococcota bacterium]